MSHCLILNELKKEAKMKLCQTQRQDVDDLKEKSNNLQIQ